MQKCLVYVNTLVTTLGNTRLTYLVNKRLRVSVAYVRVVKFSFTLYLSGTVHKNILMRETIPCARFSYYLIVCAVPGWYIGVK